jgi:hypothetical protein
LHGHAGEHTVTPDSYRAALKRLQAGDIVYLAPGVYKDGLPLHHLIGQPSRPIAVVGLQQGAAIFVAAYGRNTLSILNSAHVIVKNLVLDGQNLPVDAVKCEGHADFAHHITLENLTIRGHGNNQQTVGISTKCPAWNWVIRGNTVIGAGTGMYLGNSDGSDPFVAGLIEDNLIVDSVGYNLQIKHQAVRPDLPGMPTAPSDTVIRNNVFVKTAAPREGAQPRPSVLLGHWPKAGAGADDRYLIHGNLFYGNRTESLFQGEGNLALYTNVFVAPDRDAIRIQPHNDIPKRVVVAYNTILARGAGIVLARGPGSEQFEQTVSHNAVFASLPLTGVETGDNVVGSIEAAADYLVVPHFSLEGLDLRPKTGALRADRAWTGAPTLAGLDFDFSGVKRNPNIVGAYTESAGPLRWRPALERLHSHD